MYVLAIDIGGTFIKYALMNENAESFEKGKLPTPKEGREALIESIGGLYDRFPSAEGIAISMPGIIDSEKGYVYMGGALSYNNEFALKDALYKRCPVQITVNNDAKCAAAAEASLGALKDVSDGVVLLFGTMIGGALVIDHKVRSGVHFSAGEVSYVLSDRDKDPVYDTVWGNRCGTTGLCRIYASKKGLREEEVDGLLVFDRVDSSEKEAIEALSEYTHEIAVQIFNLQTVFDPQRFAIGGGISAQKSLIEAIQSHLDRMYENSPYYTPKAQVVACTFGNDANLIGALENYLACYAR